MLDPGVASVYMCRVSEKFCALMANNITELCVSVSGNSEAEHLRDHLRVKLEQFPLCLKFTINQMLTHPQRM